MPRHFHILRFSVAAILSFLIIGCKSESLQRIEAADKLLEERPDSALKMLETIDAASLTDEKERGYYAIAVTNAQYLSDSSAFSDSLLNSVADFFNRQGNTREKMIYLYLKALTSQQKENKVEAITLALNALGIAQEHRDLLYTGRICRLIERLYMTSYQSRQATKYAQMAYDAFNEAGYDEKADWELAAIAQGYCEPKYVDKCRQYITKTRQRGLATNNLPLLDFADRIDARLSRIEKKYRRTIDLLRNIRGPQDPNDLYDLAFAYHELEMADSARYFNDKLLALNPENKEMSVNINIADGDYSKAYENMSEAFNNQTKKVQKILDDNMGGLEAQYFYMDAERKKLTLQHTKVMTAMSAVILLLLCVVIVMRIRKVRADNRQKVDSYLKKYEALENDLAKLRLEIQQQESNLTQSRLEIQQHLQHKSEIDDSRKKLVDILGIELKRRLTMISGICNALHDNGGKTHKTKNVEDVSIALLRGGNHNVIKRLSALIAQETLSKETIQELEQLVDMTKDGIMTEFMNDMPDVYNHYGELFLFKVLGLSTSTIAFIMGMRDRSVYNNISRMRAEIKKSKHPRKQKYLNAVE